MNFKAGDFGPYKLSRGPHYGPQEGMCVMEMVSFLAGEEWSDRPACVSPVITSFCIMINDNTTQAYRDKLQLRLFKMMGTADDGLDIRRLEFLIESLKGHEPCAYRMLKEELKCLTYSSGFISDFKITYMVLDIVPYMFRKEDRVWDDILSLLDELLEIRKPEQAPEPKEFSNKFKELDEVLI